MAENLVSVAICEGSPSVDCLGWSLITWMAGRSMNSQCATTKLILSMFGAPTCSTGRESIAFGGRRIRATHCGADHDRPNGRADPLPSGC